MKRSESWVPPKCGIHGLPNDEVFRFVHIKKVGNGYEVRFERDECVLVTQYPDLLAKMILLGLGFPANLVEQLIIPGMPDNQYSHDSWTRLYRQIFDGRKIGFGSTYNIFFGDYQTEDVTLGLQDCIRSLEKYVPLHILDSGTPDFWQQRIYPVQPTSPEGWFGLAALAISIGMKIETEGIKNTEISNPVTDLRDAIEKL
jgi:hypothetical protein